MRAFFVIFALISIVNAQVPPVEVNGSASASLNPGQIQIQGDTKPNQNENNGQPSVSVQGQINSQQGGGQSAVAGSGGASDLGSFFQGISNGIADVIKGFEKPIEAAGKTACFVIGYGTDQFIRLDDYVGQTFSVSINGKPVYNGTIEAGGKIGNNGNGQNGNGQNATKRHHHERHHFESKKISNLFNKLRGESRHGGDKRHHERSDSH